MIEIEINGKKINITKKSMILEVANKFGIYIPHFCYHKKLTIAANCRMCLVEIEGINKLLPACATQVSSGMKIHTISDKIIKAQQNVMEFLLINHPLDCPICDKAGECKLQDFSVEYGKSISRYKEEKRLISPKNVGSLISMKEMNRCIYCSRCIRFGQEIAGLMELGVIGRGEYSEVTTFIGESINSELSGNMIDLCPVGALTSKPFRYKIRTWELLNYKSISPHDSLGSNLNIHVKKNKIMRVLPLENEELNECWISDKDRFSYEGLISSDRLIKPMIKRNNKWIETSWSSALEYIAKNLRNIITKYGTDSIAALTTSISTLEELILLQKIIRGLGSENIDFRLRQLDFSLDNTIIPWLGMSISELSQLNHVLIIGSFLRKDHPLFAARLRYAAKNGACINLLHATDDDLLIPITNKIIIAPSKWLETLNQIIVSIAIKKSIDIPNHLIEIKVSKISELIADDLLSNGLKSVLLGNTLSQHPNSSQLHIAAQWIATQTNSKFGYFLEGANTVGGYIANAFPNKYGINAHQLLCSPRKSYLLLNSELQLDCANPQTALNSLKQAELVIIMSPYKHNLDYAHVLLPIAPFTENSGTFINAEGRIQNFSNVIKPLGQTRPAWEVLKILGNLLKLSNFDYSSSKEIYKDFIKNINNVKNRLNNIVPNEIINTLINKYNYTLSKNYTSSTLLNNLERVSDIPIYFTDSIVRRALSLQKTNDANMPLAWLSKMISKKLKIIKNDRVKIKQDQYSIELNVAIDNKLPDNVIRISAGHNSTIALNKMFGKITLEKI